MIDDTFFFFFFWDAQNIVFLKLQLKQLCVLRSDRRRSEIWYTCNVNTFVPVYAMAKVKYTNCVAVHKHPTRPPHRRRSSVPPQRFFSLPETSTVQIFSCLTLIGTHPSAAAHKLWMAVDRPGSRLSWRWVICTAYSEQRSRLWTRTRHYSIRAMTSVISLPAKGRSLAAGSSLVQCRRFSLARSLAVVAPWCKERRLYAAHVTGKIWL